MRWVIYNRRAASNRTSKSDIVGLVVHKTVNPFHTEILRAIETELAHHDYNFILSNH